MMNVTPQKAKLITSTVAHVTVDEGLLADELLMAGLHNDGNHHVVQKIISSTRKRGDGFQEDTGKLKIYVVRFNQPMFTAEVLMAMKAERLRPVTMLACSALIRKHSGCALRAERLIPLNSLWGDGGFVMCPFVQMGELGITYSALGKWTKEDHFLAVERIEEKGREVHHLFRT